MMGLQASRVMAEAPDGTVLFIVGMHINQCWSVHRWVPVALGMRRMLDELVRNRDLGLLGKPRIFTSGRLIVVIQYWKSFEALEAYARSDAGEHLPAWKAFRSAVKDSTAVGIFHETYTIKKGCHESIYIHLPSPILLAAAVDVSNIGHGDESSRERLSRK
jgi:hypothetical protein